MAESRLHELSAKGQSVWIDSISREWLQNGFLEKLMREDAVVGVTSNPTIFQKALAGGTWYDEQLQEVLRTSRSRRRSSTGSPSRTSRTPATAPAGLGRRRRQGRLRLDGGRPDARLRARGDDRRGDAAARVDRPAEPVRQDPRHRARARRDRGVHRARPLDQRDADLRARPLRGGRRGVREGARAARRGRRRPEPCRVGRVVLRLPRRHRGGPAARRGRRAGAEGAARGREREARLRALRARSSPARAGRRSPRRARRRSAASGPRPRRRTPTTRTPSTSTS